MLLFSLCSSLSCTHSFHVLTCPSALRFFPCPANITHIHFTSSASPHVTTDTKPINQIRVHHIPFSFHCPLLTKKLFLFPNFLNAMFMNTFGCSGQIKHTEYSQCGKGHLVTTMKAGAPQPPPHLLQAAMMMTAGTASATTLLSSW